MTKHWFVFWLVSLSKQKTYIFAETRCNSTSILKYQNYVYLHRKMFFWCFFEILWSVWKSVWKSRKSKKKKTKAWKCFNLSKNPVWNLVYNENKKNTFHIFIIFDIFYVLKIFFNALITWAWIRWDREIPGSNASLDTGHSWSRCGCTSPMASGCGAPTWTKLALLLHFTHLTINDSVHRHFEMKEIQAWKKILHLSFPRKWRCFLIWQRKKSQIQNVTESIFFIYLQHLGPLLLLFIITINLAALPSVQNIIARSGPLSCAQGLGQMFSPVRKFCDPMLPPLAVFMRPCSRGCAILLIFVPCSEVR